MAVGLGLDRAVPGHDQNAPVHPQHLDRHPVKSGQHVAGDHLIDGAERGFPVPQIEHPIDRAEQRVQIVCGKQHGHAARLLDFFDQRDDRLLEMRVEADQRLVEQ